MKTTKKKRIIIAVCAVALIAVIAVVAIIIKNASGKQFSCDELNITVSVDFKEDSNRLKYMSRLSIPSMVLVDDQEYIYVFQDKKTGSSSESLDQYIEDTRAAELDSFENVSDIKQGDGFKYFELTSRYLDEHKNETGEKTRSILAFFESEDKFWMIQIGGPESNFSTRVKTYLKWAKSVGFSE